MEFSHRSVMLNECIDGLNIKPDGIYVDGTCGGAGHSFEIAKRLDTGKLICIDQDPDAIAAASKRLEPYKERVIIVKSNFSEAAGVCRNLGYDRIDGLLLDLGVSSFQLDEASRGFSYNADAPLDMRMSDTNPLTAYEVVNSYSESELKRILFEYGEERFAGRIASKIVNARAIKPIETTIELSELIKSAIPSAARNGGHHPAKRSFQAIRIEVNGELDVIAPTIETVCGVMNSGGRMAIITFHSLEDRAVKQAYQKLAEGCTCPKNFPVCVCGNKPKIKIITKKPIVPSETELEENPRSRSAKLRIAEKI
ncbi:MAG: 16S rRNA (cytosine(1402)-N(4))-methyltransferase RsmH [Clostridia bacterium]|nr:16S rRNA (cytosine(1402)-N(4))-methyltransferase RsmH [Clostridia bacterium]MDY3785948.1 16S rRNA (cytosine(1402)-N(4))-methyltransferase RsmH [Eubacteriales bacterium]